MWKLVGEREAVVMQNWGKKSWKYGAEAEPSQFWSQKKALILGMQLHMIVLLTEEVLHL